MRNLHKWEERLLAEGNGKPFIFREPIADCEHWGDVNNVKRSCDEFCKKHGGKVLNTYWDGQDCGTAYVECEFPYNRVQEVMLSDWFYYSPIIKKW